MKTNKNQVSQMLMSIAIAATTFCFTACSSENPLEMNPTYARKANTANTNAGGKAGPAERTVLIYMAGKNNLSSHPAYHYLNADLEEIKQGSRRIGDNSCLLVFVRRFLPEDNNNTETPWLARIQNGEVTDSVSVNDMGITLSDPRASNPQVMEQVMNYAYKKYPATRDYGLVLWSHSTGWMMENSTANTRAFGMDRGNSVDGRAEWINIPDLKNVLAKQPHLKFIMADCCHFMCLETLYELRGVADYVIGSPAEIPGEGAPYQDVVPAMFESTGFYTSIANSYYNKVSGNLPLSVVKMDEMDRVAQATGNALKSAKAKIGNGYADLTGMIHYGSLGTNESYDAVANFFFDAGDFISRYASPTDYQQWKQALDRAVVEKRIGYTWDTLKKWNIHFNDFKMNEERYHGVSLFVPQDPSKGGYSKFNTDIRQLSWYDAVGLAEFYR